LETDRPDIVVARLGAAGGAVEPAAFPFGLASALFFAPLSVLADPVVSASPEAGGDAAGPFVEAADATAIAEPGDFGCARAEAPKTNPRDNPKNKTFQYRIFDPLELAGRTELKTLDHGAAQFDSSKLQSSGNRKDF
jgi:hypothetical protein